MILECFVLGDNFFFFFRLSSSGVSVGSRTSCLTSQGPGSGGRGSPWDPSPVVGRTPRSGRPRPTPHGVGGTKTPSPSRLRENLQVGFPRTVKDRTFGGLTLDFRLSFGSTTGRYRKIRWEKSLRTQTPVSTTSHRSILTSRILPDLGLLRREHVRYCVYKRVVYRRWYIVDYTLKVGFKEDSLKYVFSTVLISKQFLGGTVLHLYPLWLFP